MATSVDNDPVGKPRPPPYTSSDPHNSCSSSPDTSPTTTRARSAVSWATPQSYVSPCIRPSTAIGWENKNPLRREKGRFSSPVINRVLVKDPERDLGEEGCDDGTEMMGKVSKGSPVSDSSVSLCVCLCVCLFLILVSTNTLYMSYSFLLLCIIISYTLSPSSSLILSLSSPPSTPLLLLMLGQISTLHCPLQRQPLCIHLNLIYCLHECHLH